MKDRIKSLCRSKGVSMSKVEDELDFGRGYLSKLGQSTPSGTKLQQLADYFGVSVEYLLTGETSTPYYLSDDARELVDFLYVNPEYKVLFDASRKVKREDIKKVAQIIDIVRKQND